MNKPFIAPLLRLGLALLILQSSLAATANTADRVDAASSTPRALKLSGVRPGGAFPVEYVEAPYSLSLNAFVWGLTIEAWVKRTDATRSESIVCNGWLQSYCLGLVGGKVRLQTAGAASFVDSAGGVPAGAWTHIAATYDLTYQRIYINGRLDTVRYYPGQVQAASSTPLGIGADLVNDYNQNYFAGLIDNVRVWGYARSASDLRATMFQAIGGSQTSLLAEWRLEGDVLDSTGQHNGILHSAMFVEDGAIPHDLRAPLTNGAPTVDGVCNTTTEYASAPHVMVGLAAAYVLHTSTDLWVCLDGLEEPTGGHDNWAAVYLDPDWSRDDNAQSTDLSLEAHSDGSLRARQGDGLGNYTLTNSATGQWTAYYRAFFNGFVTVRSAEFRVSSSLLGSQVFGLALGQQWITGVGDDRIWPALAWYNSPATWSALTLGGGGVPRTFTGRVAYQPRDPTAPASGIPGVGVNLIGYDPNGSESIVATAASTLAGAFTLISNDDYTRHRLELDTPSLPQGYMPLAASSGYGTPFDARTIDFGTVGTGTYVDNVYSLSDARPAPPDTTVAPFFLIVASQQVIGAGALTDFVDYKRHLGFQVEVVSVEYAEQSFPGANRLQKIRNLEINRRNLYGSRFRYVMLVGWDNTIPIGHVGAGYPYLLQHCQDTANWPTDWFYADLTGNFDTNGNGCWGDVGNPDDQVNYPADDPTQAYRLTVAVGRIPFGNAATVRQVLGDSMAFEQQAGDYKRQTLLAESMMELKGDNGKGWCWLPYHDPNGRYYNEGDTYEGQPVHCSNFLSATGTDNSYLGQAMQQDWLNANNYGSVTLYENMPAGVGGSPYQSSVALTPGALTAALSQSLPGFVHLGGHGSADGVSRTYWMDRNGDNAVQVSTQPTGDPLRGEGEIYQTELLRTISVGVTATVPAGRAGIYVVAACETGFNQAAGNFGTQLLSQRVAAAWVGALSTAPYQSNWTQLGQGGMADLTYDISRRILADQARLGDAVWEANNAYIAPAHKKLVLYRDPRHQLFDLFGDPTLSYWGNPGGDSTYAPWPMMRQNAFGQGRTSLSGPGVPQQRWTYSALARVLDPIPPSPIVSSKNEVIVVHGSFVDVLLNGARYQRLTLSQPAYGTPALAADGTVYALDRAGRLYAFVPTPCVPQGQTLCSILSLLIPPRTLRWSVDLGGAPLGSPIVGPNGFIFVPAEAGDGSAIAAVRPDGFLWKQFGLPNATIVGSIAASGSRIYATTSGGALVRVTPDGVGCTNDCFLVVQGDAAFTTPPLLANGSLYAGRSNSTLAKFNLDTLALQASFTTDSAVTAGPTLGPGGQVIVGTQAGTLYGLWPSLALRWQRFFGASMRGVPAASAEAVYIGSGDYVYALNPFSGAIEWLGNLGPGRQGGSGAIGYGREIYVQTGAGPIVAIGEGWAEPPDYMQATPSQESAVGGGAVKSIVVQWALPPMAGPATTQTAPTGLRLQRSDDGQAWQDLAVLPPGTEIYTDTTISAGVRYSYRVQALSGDGRDSDFAALLTSIPSLPALPAAPRIISATAQAADQVEVTWSDAAGSSVGHYRLERSLNAAGPYVTAAVTSGEVNRFSDSGLTPDTTYYYRVIAVNETGESAASNAVSGTTRQQCLDAPTNVLAVLLEHNHVRITWEGAPADVRAVVEFNPQGSSAFRFLGTANETGPFEYQEINPNDYGYRVKFVQGDNESDYGVAQLRLIVPAKEVFQVLLPLIVR